MLLPVVIAGGTGSRLWPMSRELQPKQFLSFHQNGSMLQNTIARLDGLEVANPIVICNEDHRFLVAEQLRQMHKLAGNIILEPVGRNTAPAITLAALHAQKTGEDPVLLILAADHLIADTTTFHTTIANAIPFAKMGKLVTFGIVPTQPETGYGYIQRGEEQHVGHSAAWKIKRFVEKPNQGTAISYLESNEYLWNSGMFMFRASSYLNEVAKFCPLILDACKKAMQQPLNDLDFIKLDKEIFSSCPSDSIDYAVMEHTDLGIVSALDAGWNDVGSWSALWETSPHDAQGNALIGDVFAHQTRDCYIRSESKLTAALGLDNLIIVNTQDALLVSHKDNVQDVKIVVEHLKKNFRNEFREHTIRYMPWGHVETLVRDARYKVNRVTIIPDGELSFQLHHHRIEHWVVLTGTAQIRIEEQQIYLTENESTTIPVGKKHQLSNPGKINLEILEIQFGSYLGDDDVKRVS
ncbi:mannose-1-phosphate guanylyltransferase/mannose-6-phosphate isomerase [Enterobacter cancerogenus]|uniref:mannose-1-phosphate guanylyltransferase/mannose-6-phosphate isomerase n=1 Tax=Enterobacter cancerogenus TaxID=69218 RepID=UPI000C9B3537|nr:mannose-1-phosphate guanylyltransferase/mannose-6-phosphate isomerase [Enterobacter cancerogenus]PNF10257.1 mannose-1-phosphate guanylyltransferase/mannose-6-phosphate isomerase [Enterobacter cancerogenus]